MADIYARHVLAITDRQALLALAIDMPARDFKKRAMGGEEWREARNELDEQEQDRNVPEEVSPGVWEYELRHPLTVPKKGGADAVIETVTINHPTIGDYDTDGVDDEGQLRRLIARITGLKFGQIDQLRLGDYTALASLAVSFMAYVDRGDPDAGF